MNALNINFFSLTYKVLTTSQPDYLHNLISVQSTSRIRSSSYVTLARPSVSSSLQIINRSFTYASPYPWNQLPSLFRQPHSVYSPPGSPHPAHITSSQSPPSLSSPITPSTFRSIDLTLISFTNFLHSHSYSFRTLFTDLNLYWIKGALLCLFQFLFTCARLSWILSFQVHVKHFYRIVSYVTTYVSSFQSIPSESSFSAPMNAENHAQRNRPLNTTGISLCPSSIEPVLGLGVCHHELACVSCDVTNKQEAKLSLG